MLLTHVLLTHVLLTHVVLTHVLLTHVVLTHVVLTHDARQRCQLVEPTHVADALPTLPVFPGPRGASFAAFGREKQGGKWAEIPLSFGVPGR